MPPISRFAPVLRAPGLASVSRVGVVCALILGLATGCDLGTTAYDEPVSLLPFKAPLRYVVRKGDSLALVALAHGVSPEHIRAWNGLLGADDLAAGKILLIWDPPEPEPAVQAAASPARASRKRSGRRTATTTRHLPPPVAIAATEAVVVTARPIERRPTVLNAGILGGLSDSLGGSGLGEGILAGVAGLSRGGTTGGGSGLDRRGSMGGTGEVGSLDGDALQVRRNQPAPRTGVGTGSVRVPRLARPAPKRCLAGPNGADLRVDDGMLASKGLSSGQVQATMGTFLRKTTSCIPAGSSGTVTVHADVVVGCDGRVQSADVSGAVPDHVASCISTTLGYASFPAHDMPAGFSFRYPITYRL